ncbi:MAG: sugar transferase [bacterium]|nr:sugar transferase [bacterium]MDZ4295880.1 sugar transferase [Patescibacteria group bacterium]
MTKRRELFWTVLRVPLDLMLLFGAGIAAYLVRTTPWVAAWRPVLFRLDLPLERYAVLAALFSVAGVSLFALAGLYSLRTRNGIIRELAEVALAVSAGFTGLVLLIFVRGELFNSRFVFLAAWAFAIVFVGAGRLFLYAAERYLLARHGFGRRRVLVIGRDLFAHHIERLIKEHPRLGYEVLKVLPEPDIAAVKAAVYTSGVDEVILADPDYPREQIVDLIEYCHEQYLSFKFVPNLFQALTTNVGMDLFGDVPLIELKRTSLEGWGSVVKRLMDSVLALVIAVLASPFSLLIAILIKWDSEGPVFVRLKRISQGREFELFKFRSMIDNAHLLKPSLMEFNERTDGGPLFKMKNDPRVTRVGRLLRRTRLDEFAQLINVLRGEMSLVGPRPHEPEEVARYEKQHRKVLAIKPGITGLAQVSGASDLSFEDEVRLDTFYIERWSLALDLKILAKTTLIFLRGDGSAV